MTPLLVNTYDTIGGAALASNRLLNGLKQNGVKARMLVQEKHSEHPDVLKTARGRFQEAAVGFRTLLDQQPLRTLYPNRRPAPYSLNWLPGPYGRHLKKLMPDIVNLHWINAGFISLGAIGSIQSPVVWTLHDMWPFTGVCHYSDDCLEYRNSCGNCRMLGSDKASDISRWNWKRKQKAISKLNLTLVSPSRWLAEQAQRSRLLRCLPIHVIPNGLDLSVFKPADKEMLRRLLGMEGKERLILFGGAHVLKDRRKGAHLLSRALELVKGVNSDMRLKIKVFGASRAERGLNFYFDTEYIGFVHDERLLAQIYAAADIFVAPSTQENLANTVLESLSCGTPVVAFDTGGMKEMISHEHNGYLATALDAKSFARGIVWALEDDERIKRLSRAARETATTKFDILRSAKSYSHLFRDLIHNTRNKNRTRIRQSAIH